MIITPRSVFYGRLISEPLYLKSQIEECVIRTEPHGNYARFYVKFKGKDEFLAIPGSTIVADAELYPYEITKGEYDNY